jgi:D-amino-acid dehydrogenase
MEDRVDRQKADVLVVGGGMMGVCTAYYLAERGSEVMLVEKGDVGSGCSNANAGLLVPGHSMPLATPGIIAKGIRWMLNPDSPFYIKARVERDLFSWLRKFRHSCRAEKMRRSMEYLCQLNSASKQLFEELTDRGLEFFFEKKGLLIVCKTKSNLEAAVQEVKDKEKLKIPATILSKEQLLEMEPALRDDVVGGVHFPQDGHIDCHQFLRAMAEQARAKGAKIMTRTEVIGWKKEHGKVKKLMTTRGEMTADQIVLAAGAWSAALVKELGLRLPIQAAKGYSLSYKKPVNSPSMPMILSETKVAVTPLPGILRLGGTLELAGVDLRINRRRVEAIIKTVPNYLRGLKAEEMELVELWRGLRPCSPDGVPLLGRCERYNNLVVASGHAMQGVSLGPITGKLVSQILSGEKPMIDVGPMKVERFN